MDRLSFFTSTAFKMNLAEKNLLEISNINSMTEQITPLKHILNNIKYYCEENLKPAQETDDTAKEKYSILSALISELEKKINDFNNFLSCPESNNKINYIAHLEYFFRSMKEIIDKYNTLEIREKLNIPRNEKINNL